MLELMEKTSVPPCVERENNSYRICIQPLCRHEPLRAHSSDGKQSTAMGNYMRQVTISSRRSLLSFSTQGCVSRPLNIALSELSQSKLTWLGSLYCTKPHTSVSKYHGPTFLHGECVVSNKFKFNLNIKHTITTLFCIDWQSCFFSALSNPLPSPSSPASLFSCYLPEVNLTPTLLNF